MVRYALIRLGMVRYDFVRLGMVRWGGVGFGKVWLGLVRKGSKILWHELSWKLKVKKKTY